jgi:RNA polymerase sigma-70 factor (ECF subfamily)
MTPSGCETMSALTTSLTTTPATPIRPAGSAARRGRPLESGSYREVDPDGDLVVRWQGGDASAFEELIRRHETRVFRLLMRMLGSREEAEDVSQETFLSLHRHGHKFRHDARFSTFIYRVAANAALNRRRTLGRKNARIRQLQARNAAGDDLPTVPRDPESAASGVEVQSRVQDALLRLPADLRMATVLYDIEGLSYKEIASALGIPEGTVKSRIHRARSALRDRLKGLVRAEMADVDSAGTDADREGETP